MSVDEHAGALQRRFVVPPFSVLDTRAGYWQERRRAWLSLGIKSEVGRPTQGADSSSSATVIRGGLARELGRSSIRAGATASQDTEATASVFDPVLCELAYRWFTEPGGSVLDPFAGGSVRGVVAAFLGYRYTGIELRREQVESNYEQAKSIGVSPIWNTGDARSVLAVEPPTQHFDLLFSCPPYYNLEKYGDDPADLANAPTYDDFLAGYRDVIAKSAAWLRDDRYAVWVVSEVRDNYGPYFGLVPDTVAAFRDAGMAFYNEAVLVNSAGTIPLRIGKQFAAGRKLGRMHQNVLVFTKGHPKPKGWDIDVTVAPPEPQFEMFA